MKNSKAAQVTRVVADMLKADGDIGLEWTEDVCNEVVKEGRVREEWNKS